MNPLNSVAGSITAGIVLAVLIAIGIDSIDFNELSLARWFHVLAGIMWIGLLYYFNVAQTPALAAAAADKGGPGGAGITKYVAPRALFWFRWAAVATWLTGFWYLLRRSGVEGGGDFVNALTLGRGGEDLYGLVIGIGMWLGTIMLFNVWVLIWPNQRKILGIVPATDEEKAKARKTAGLASRTNFVLSIPMLICMIGAGHGLPF
ncbi:MAG TPA: urate hydroxylase PuuD [Steroidobacteraceae bacterium]|nr:urate hydroxylase PuuD [Steroidobacteraceae bacterium]